MCVGGAALSRRQFNAQRFKKALKFYGISDLELQDRMFEIYQEQNEAPTLPPRTSQRGGRRACPDAVGLCAEQRKIGVVRSACGGAVRLSDGATGEAVSDALPPHGHG